MTVIAGTAATPPHHRHAGCRLTPPYGAQNYCVNTSIQFYNPTLAPLGHNIRIREHTFDPQLSAPHSGCATCQTTFIGDYFGNDTGPGPNGYRAYTSFVSTYGGDHHQQQIVGTLAVP